MKSVAEEMMEQGEIKARAEYILKLLTGRGIRVGSRARQRILACQDLATLDRWFTRAIRATSTAELFCEPLQ
jgi:hypothetical protein